MRTTNEFSKLLSMLSRQQGSQAMASSSGPSLLHGAQHGVTSRIEKPKAGRDLIAVGLETRQVKAIDFGSPSQRATSAVTPGTPEWQKLLKQTASEGISSALGGGLLNAAGGLGGLISGIAGLFGGGKKAIQAPVTFQLPGSLSKTVYVRSTSGVSKPYVSKPASSSQSETTPRVSRAGVTATGSSQLQGAQIVQAVKQAILHSSSLNDVIAEL